jgi:hypothetical protein
MTTDAVADVDLDPVARRLDENMHTSNPPALRDRSGVAAFLRGLEVVDPGLVPVTEWRPDGDAPATERPTAIYGGVARKR